MIFLGAQSKDSKDWKKGLTSVGRRKNRFALNFTATVGGSGYLGDIALDNITLINCGPPSMCTGNDPGKFM